MTPFPKGKGKVMQVYVPLRAGFVQRSTGTTNAALARRIERCVRDLHDQGTAFDLLEAVKDRRVTLLALYEAYAANKLGALRAQLDAKRLADYLPGWLAVAKQTAPAAWPDQQRQVKKLLGLMGPTLPALTTVSELTAGAVRDRLAALSSSPGTRRHYLYALSSFCTHLVAHGVLAVNPCLDRSLVPRPGKSGKRTVWHEEATDRAIVDRITDPDIRIVAVLCAAAGADRSTPLAMHVRDLHLLPEGTAPDPEQGLEHRVDLPGSKTEGRDRKGVRLEPWAVPILRAWIKGKLPAAPLVDPALKEDRVTRHWAAACEAAGIRGYWLRDTRHSYGVRAFLAGFPLWEISKWLGHADPSITAGIYLAFDYEVVRRIREGTATGTATADSAPVLMKPAGGHGR